MLRVVVGLTAGLQGATYLAWVEEPTGTLWTIGWLAIISGASMLIGFLTPGAGVVAGSSIIVMAVSWFPMAAASPLIDRVGALCVAAVAAALVLLGPGALSLDARLFGRREIVFPQDSNQKRP